MDEPRLRLFVVPASCQGQRLVLAGDDARRAFARGARAGDKVVVLDNSGWEISVVLEGATAEACLGRVVGRRLAKERRSKVSIYQGLLHPSDLRRLVTRATELGVVAFVPVIADASMVPLGGLGGDPETDQVWQRLLRDAAEAAGRGRCPTLGSPMLYDHALDQALRGGGAVMLVDPAGGPVAEALGRRPFSIEAFFPSPGGFTPDERARALARGVAVVAPPRASNDPVAPALAILEAIYATLETDGTADGTED